MNIKTKIALVTLSSVGLLGCCPLVLSGEVNPYAQKKEVKYDPRKYALLSKNNGLIATNLEIQLNQLKAQLAGKSIEDTKAAIRYFMSIAQHQPERAQELLDRRLTDTEVLTLLMKAPAEFWAFQFKKWQEGSSAETGNQGTDDARGINTNWAPCLKTSKGTQGKYVCHKKGVLPVSFPKAPQTAPSSRSSKPSAPSPKKTEESTPINEICIMKEAVVMHFIMHYFFYFDPGKDSEYTLAKRQDKLSAILGMLDSDTVTNILCHSRKGTYAFTPENMVGVENWYYSNYHRQNGDSEANCVSGRNLEWDATGPLCCENGEKLTDKNPTMAPTELGFAPKFVANILLRLADREVVGILEHEFKTDRKRFDAILSNLAIADIVDTSKERYLMQYFSPLVSAAIYEAAQSDTVAKQLLLKLTGIGGQELLALPGGSEDNPEYDAHKAQASQDSSEQRSAALPDGQDPHREL